jgi:hypothetical protein
LSLLFFGEFLLLGFNCLILFSLFGFIGLLDGRGNGCSGFNFNRSRLRGFGGSLCFLLLLSRNLLGSELLLSSELLLFLGKSLLLLDGLHEDEYTASKKDV